MMIDNFFAELKRRNVYKVAVAYAVAAEPKAYSIYDLNEVFLPNE